MQRHILDKPKVRDHGIRTREFLRLAREEGNHPALRTLHQRPREERGATKLRAYTSIDRGRTA